MSKTLYRSDESVSWFSALKQSWRATMQFDRSQLTAVQAIRSTIVFILPLALGVATNHIVEGVSIAGGAALLGAVGLTSSYHARIRTLLLACVGIALSAFVGSLTGGIGWLSVLVTGIWGIGAGLLVALDQPTMIASLQSAVALIILTHFALDPLHAALQAILMFAGALLQTLVTMIPSPGQRTAPERMALSTVYQTLANYALHPTDGQNSQRIRDALFKAYSALSDSKSKSQQGQIFFGLLEEAEYIRLSLIVLTRLRQSLAEDTAIQMSSATYINELLQATADQLQEIAQELVLSPLFPQLTQRHHRIKDSLTALRRQKGIAHEEGTTKQVLTYGNALRAQLQGARQLAMARPHRHQELPINVSIPQAQHLRFHDAKAILRANLTPRSTAFRHAIRLGIALALATALYHIFPLPLERGYWIPLTVIFILNPDFTTTFTRGIARALGTILGAALSTVLLVTLVPSNELLVFIDALMAYFAFSVLFANYALFSTFITMQVIFLLTFVIPQPLATAVDRIVATVIGSVLALLIYTLWPTWEASQTPGYLAERVEAVRHYAVAVLKAYANPSAYDSLTLRTLRKKSRLARSNAEASIQHSLQEPGSLRMNPDVARGLFGAMDILVRSALVLEAYLIDSPSRHVLPAIAVFAQKVDEALRVLATAIHEEQKVTSPPNLQAALHTFERATKHWKHMPAEAHADLPIVRAEAKQIVRTLDIMYRLLSTEGGKNN